MRFLVNGVKCRNVDKYLSGCDLDAIVALEIEALLVAPPEDDYEIDIEEFWRAEEKASRIPIYQVMPNLTRIVIDERLSLKGAERFIGLHENLTYCDMVAYDFDFEMPANILGPDSLLVITRAKTVNMIAFAGEFSAPDATLIIVAADSEYGVTKPGVGVIRV